MGIMGFCTALAHDIHGHGREWIDITEVDLRLDRTPDALKGIKIVQLSDLHCGKTVSKTYLNHCIERVNQLNPDIIALTGDYITHDLSGRYTDLAIDLLSKLKSKHGTYACLGNHDYGTGTYIRNKRQHLLDEMIAKMHAKGINLLRNESETIEIDGVPLTITGLGDLWTKDFDADKAFAKATKTEPSITLLHNPTGIDQLKHHPSSLILSGHTHGIDVPFSTALKPIVKKRLHNAGLYTVGHHQLYVNRGLGRLGRSFFNARPEITLFTLK